MEQLQKNQTISQSKVYQSMAGKNLSKGATNIVPVAFLQNKAFKHMFDNVVNNDFLKQRARPKCSPTPPTVKITPHESLKKL